MSPAQPRYSFVIAAAAFGMLLSSHAAVLRVPGEHKTIQAALDAARDGDVVEVAPGIYKGRIKMKAGVTLKSAGDNAKGKFGLRRAEQTVIDGGGEVGEQPGVLMAERSVLDGFTVTKVELYDEAKWKKHYASRGEHQKHEHIGNYGVPAIASDRISNCTITNNIVHHNGDTGIHIRGKKGKKCSPRVLKNICYRNMAGGIGSTHGSTATIEQNICFENFYAGIGQDDASPLIENNECYENVRAGIGIAHGSCPTVKKNKCYRNRRAGIGIRTGSKTKPIIEDNDCYENGMAGIGASEKSEPTIRKNRCWANLLTGIGAQSAARPLIEGNKCWENTGAGIGLRGKADAVIKDNICTRNKASGIGVAGGSTAKIINNQCLENALVAIGVPSGKATISGNRLERQGGMPPILSVLKGSSAVITNNVIKGGGVAGILLRGEAEITSNRFEGTGPRPFGPPNYAVWAQGSKVTFTDNTVDRWRHALHATSSEVTASKNTISRFVGTAIVISKPTSPAIVQGNTALTNNKKDKVVSVDGALDKVTGNLVKRLPRE